MTKKKGPPQRRNLGSGGVMNRNMHAGVSLRSALTALTLALTFVAARASQNVPVGPSGLPLPRFVSLKASKANLRVGPGLNYSVEWTYLKPGLPMEITQEFDNWRKVRDADGAEGWINESLLSGRRTGIVAPWNKGKDATIDLRAGPQDSASAVAILEPGVVGSIDACNGHWCEMTFKGHTGWVDQSLVWGAYPDETVSE